MPGAFSRRVAEHELQLVPSSSAKLENSQLVCQHWDFHRDGGLVLPWYRKAPAPPSEWEQLLGRQKQWQDLDEPAPEPVPSHALPFREDGAPFQLAEVRSFREDGLSGDAAALYEVVYARIAIRASPCVEAQLLGVAFRGERLQTYGWNEEGLPTWRSVRFELCNFQRDIVVAWVLVAHPTLGDLLRKVRPEGNELENGGVALPAAEAAALPEPVLEELWEARPLSGAELSRVAKVAPPVPHKVPKKKELSEWERMLGEKENDSDSCGSDGEDDEEIFEYVSGESALEAAERGGQVFEVIAATGVVIRSKPSSDEGKAICCGDFAQRFDTFGWDQGKKWRRVFCQLNESELLVNGWIMVRHRADGTFLKKVT